MVSRKLNRRRNKRNTRQRKGKKETSKLIKCRRCNKSKRISRKKFDKLRNAGIDMNDIYNALCCYEHKSLEDSVPPSMESAHVQTPVQAIPILTQDGMGYTINSASMQRATNKALLFGNSNMVNKQLIGRYTIIREKDINGKSIPYKHRRAYITVYKGDNATTLVNDFQNKHPRMLFPNDLVLLERNLNAYLNRPASRGISALRGESMDPVLKGIKIENKKGNSEIPEVDAYIPVGAAETPADGAIAADIPEAEAYIPKDKSVLNNLQRVNVVKPKRESIISRVTRTLRKNKKV